MKIPKGWRRLNSRAILRKGDKWTHCLSNGDYWFKTTALVGMTCVSPCIYIRMKTK